MNTYQKRILANYLSEREKYKMLHHSLLYRSGDKKRGSAVAVDLEQAERLLSEFKNQLVRSRINEKAIDTD